MIRFYRYQLAQAMSVFTKTIKKLERLNTRLEKAVEAQRDRVDLCRAAVSLAEKEEKELRNFRKDVQKRITAINTFLGEEN